MRRGFAGVLWMVLPLAAAGCPDNVAYLGGDCSDPVGHGGDPQALPRACPVADAGPEAGGDCECVQVPGFWYGPTWLWYGPVGQAPKCDGESFYEGYADFASGGTCEVCTCEPPTGSCALPSTLTVSTKACNLPGGQASSFNAPSPWNGQCDGSTAAPPGVALSLTIDPRAIVENGCQAGPPVPAKVIPAQPATFALGCHGQGWSACGDVISSACIPRDQTPPPGFHLCILGYGDQDCPADVSFTEKHVFYDHADEACADCGCGPPQGSLCKAALSVYEDGMCGGPLVDQISVSSVSLTCVDIQPPGQALGSKSAGAMTYIPGTCEPFGGQGSGMITGVKPSTLCCRP